MTQRDKVIYVRFGLYVATIAGMTTAATMLVNGWVGLAVASALLLFGLAARRP